MPTDLTQLATRAGTRASVVRALERLDRFALQTAEALAVAPDPAPYDELLALLAGDEGDPRRRRGAAARRWARCASRPWCGATTTGCGWCAPPANCSPRPRSTRPRPASGPTVAEATAGMSPGRMQEILAAAGLPTTHDPVSAVAALTALFTDRDADGGAARHAPRRRR